MSSRVFIYQIMLKVRKVFCNRLADWKLKGTSADSSTLMRCSYIEPNRALAKESEQETRNPVNKLAEMSFYTFKITSSPCNMI